MVINWDIVSHPMNWVTLILMVLIAAVAIHLVLDFGGAKLPSRSGA